MAMYNRRWLEEPEMTDAEVRRWVTGPRLSQGDRVIVDNRSFTERADSMEKSGSQAQGVAGINADKIVRELRNRAIQEAELNKQKAHAVTEGVESGLGISGAPGSGPADIIRKFAGLPQVTKRAGRKKTHKNKKSKRKTRKSTK